jgi:uncharacterized membrane protein YgcG
MMKIKAYIIAVLSAGWLFPLFLIGTNFAAYLKTELEPEIVGKPVTHSFPILLVCNFWFAIAALWLACVIVCWSLFFLRTRGNSLGKSGRGGGDSGGAGTAGGVVSGPQRGHGVQISQ